MRNTTKFVHKYTLNSLHSPHVRSGCKITKRMQNILLVGRSGVRTLPETTVIFLLQEVQAGLEAYCKGGQGPPRAVAPPKKKKKKVQAGSGALQPPTQWASGALPRAQSDRWLMLTTQLHLGQRLRISGAIPLLPLYALL